MDREVVKRLVYSMIQFLQSQLEGGAGETGGLTEEGVESVEVALQCLETAYGVSLAQSELALPKTLYQIVAEAAEAHIPVQETETITILKAKIPTEADKAEAEELKNRGNQLMRDENFPEALDCYTRAITKDSQNAVYYCNRAAAHSKLNHHPDAIQDCKRALQIEPQYSKAYGRMGLAYSSVNDHQKAKDCYLKALELEPDNESYKGNLAIAEEKIRSEPANPPNPFAGMGSISGLLAGNGAAGNGPDLSNLLSNPALMNMATQLMADPNMQNMMTNLMGGIGSGIPGMPMGVQGLPSAVQQPNNSVPNSGGAPPSGGSGSGGGGGIEALLTAGRQLAEQMQSQHPELVEHIRQQMNRGPNSGSGDPPGGGNQDPSSQS